MTIIENHPVFDINREQKLNTDKNKDTFGRLFSSTPKERKPFFRSVKWRLAQTDSDTEDNKDAKNVTAVTLNNVYSVSHNYRDLVKLARKQPVICVVPYKQELDIARTNHIPKKDNGDEYFEIRARGIVYLYAFNEDEFVEECVRQGVVFLAPTIK